MTSSDRRTSALFERPIRVLMIVDDFPPAFCGVGDYTDSLARSLANQAVDVTVATKRTAGLSGREQRDRLDIQRIAEGWVLSDISRILKLVDELGPSVVVHFQYSSKSGYNRRPMINILPAVLRIARPNNPVVVTMHGFHEQGYKYRLRAAPMLIAAGYRVFVHALDRAMISRWLDPRGFPSALIPIGSNIPTVEITRSARDHVRAGLGVHSDLTALVVFFGDLRPEKGFFALLRSLRDVRSSGVDLRLALLTDMDCLRKWPVYAGELDRLIAETGATEWMKVLERLDHYSVARTMRASDLAIFPFASGACENRGSLLAALANNVPVLTTRGPSTPRNFELDYGVESVVAGDERALSDRVEALLRNPEELRALQRKAARAPNKPRWDAIASDMISVYRAAFAAQQSQFSSSSVAMPEGT